MEGGMKVKIFKTMKIAESAVLLVFYALAAVFLFYQSFFSEEMKELGLLYLLVLGYLIIGGVACVAGVALSLMAMGFIGLAKEPRRRRCGFVLACITKALVSFFFLCFIVIRVQKGNYTQLWWMIPAAALFLEMSITDIAGSKKMQLW